MSDVTKWVGVDLDGTLAYYDNDFSPTKIGEPIPKMVERVKQWLEEGKEVRIFTARVGTQKDNRIIPDVIKAIEEWCEKHIGRKLPITNLKDFGLIELWDDRAVRVIKNTGEVAMEIAIPPYPAVPLEAMRQIRIKSEKYKELARKLYFDIELIRAKADEYQKFADELQSLGDYWKQKFHETKDC